MHSAAARRAAPTRTARCSAQVDREPRPSSRRWPTRSYPARKGYDQFYGYGRVNMAKRAVERPSRRRRRSRRRSRSPRRTGSSRSIPTQATVDVRGRVYARGGGYTCRVYVAPGLYPNNGRRPTSRRATSRWSPSAGATARSARAPFDGVARDRRPGAPEGALPGRQRATSTGREPRAGPPNFNGRPEHRALRRSSSRSSSPTSRPARRSTGQDRRNLYLHRDQDLLPGFPQATLARATARPRRALADLDGDNHNELIFGDLRRLRARAAARRHRAAGLAGARRPAPAAHRRPRLHAAARSTRSLARRDPRLARGRRPRPRRLPEVVAADFEGKLYVWDAGRERCVFTARGEPRLTPASRCTPFVERPQAASATARSTASSARRCWPTSTATAAASRSSPPRWTATSTRGTPTATPSHGFPVLVVDRRKITAIDPQTHAVTFNGGVGADPTRARSSTRRRSATSTGDGKPGDRGRHQRGVRRPTATTAASTRAG